MEFITNLMDKLYSPATIFLGLLGTLVTIIFTLVNIILKTNKQKTLIKNQTIESQIGLVKIFIELLNIVDGRPKTEISKEFITGIIGKISSLKDEDEMSKALKYIENYAYFIQPIGRASQEAMASAIFNFGINNDILLEPALVGLKELNGKTINITNKSLTIMENITLLENKLKKIKKKSMK